MRRPPATVLFVPLLPVLVLALAGCANSGSKPAVPDAVKVSLQSSAVTAHKLPALYTCSGRNVNPPLEWGKIPSDTGELVLAVVGLTPVPHTQGYRASIEWAISGVNPALHRLNSGEVPEGAHVGLSTKNGHRYSICPKRGQSTQYQFMLYGVPAAARVSSNFADQPILAALSTHGAAISPTAEGAFVARYTRG
jgi:phosphatidylethanolamine-binding protein (PEBP) family uncharacterized protein